MKILVCGGRNYSDYEFLEKCLNIVHSKKKITLIIEGGASGADFLANKWAKENNINIKTFVADWKNYGRSAGPIRNKIMLDEGKPDGVIAFDGGKGTQNMVMQAKNASIKVLKPKKA